MTDGLWRQRLAAALEQKGMSKRRASLDSGNGPGYVHGILNEGKDPTIDKLTSLCETLGVSATYILYGIDVTPEDEKILTPLKDNPDAREGIISILQSRLAS